jgi:GNAT superfamily N-acetyltransferase
VEEPPVEEPPVTARIRPLAAEDLAAVVRLSLAAWAPVFASFERVLGATIYRRLYPEWTSAQAGVVEAVCTDPAVTTWVAEADGRVVGFIAYKTDMATRAGEVALLAVAPASQNRGLGTRLNVFALDRLREQGMRLAVVGTGGDPGHAPARRSYEKAGYTGLPLVRYYQALDPEEPRPPERGPGGVRRRAGATPGRR